MCSFDADLYTGLLLVDGSSYHTELIEAVLPGISVKLPTLEPGSKIIGVYRCVGIFFFCDSYAYRAFSMYIELF